MISERNIAEKFSVIWRQSFPLLTPNFIRVFNEAKIIEVNSKHILTNDEVRYDLIAEAGFNLSEKVFVENRTVREFLEDKVQLEKLIKQTAKTIWTTGNYTESDLAISDIELNEIVKISENIAEFIAKVNGTVVEYRPKFKGYSFIPDLVGDLSIDDTLYEIKTVTRNFKSSDLKQLFIYLALKQASSLDNWKHAGLYNPRKGIYCRFNVKSLIYNLSGGKTPNEAFEYLLNGLVRDIEIDSRF